MLQELSERVPWNRQIITSLTDYIKRTGKLTDKQKSLVTSMYMDSCVMSDEFISDQIETRRLSSKILICHINTKTSDFICSVLTKTFNRPFTLAQIRVIKKIVEQHETEISKITDFNEATWGWTGLDKQ